MSVIYDFEVQDIQGKTISMEQFKGKWLLVVNVASACGLTPHYAGLQKLYEQFGPENFTVLGFPCNQFGAQEPGSEAEIQAFCSTKFAVSFPMFSKIEVNGANEHPLFTALKKDAPYESPAQDIEWNFAKILVSPEGKPVKRWHPKLSPEEIASEIKEFMAG